MEDNKTANQKSKPEVPKKANFAKVPLPLLDTVVKYIMNSKSDEKIGTSVAILTQLQKCDKVE